MRLAPPVLVIFLIPTLPAPAQEPPDKTTAPIRIDRGNMRHIGPVRHVHFNPDGMSVISAASDGVRIWDLKTEKEQHRWEGDIYALALDAKGQSLAALSADRLVRLWDLNARKEIARFRCSCKGGHFNADFAALAFSPDGQQLAVGFGIEAELWEHRTPTRLKTFPLQFGYAVSSVDFFPDGRRLIVSGLTSYVSSIWHLHDDTESKLLPQLKYQQTSRLSPDGRYHGVAENWAQAIALWGTDRSVSSRRFELNVMALALAFSPDTKVLAGGCEDGRVLLFHIPSSQSLGEIPTRDNALSVVAFSHDGNRLAAGGKDGRLYVWDLKTVWERVPPLEHLTVEQLQRLWDELAEQDERCEIAAKRLVGVPDQVVSFLDQRLQPARGATPEQVASLITDLRHENDEVRNKAMRELMGLHLIAKQSLQDGLKVESIPAVRRRIERLLELLDTRTLHFYSERGLCQQASAMSVLGRVRTPKANELLQRLANGADGAFITERARKIPLSPH